MAKVELQKFTNEGATLSRDTPPQGYTETVTVTTDNKDQDPFVVLQTDPEGIPYGSPHRHNIDVRANAYLLAQKLTFTQYIVIVIYVAREFTVETWDGWLPSYHTGDVIVRRKDSLPIIDNYDVFPFRPSNAIGIGSDMIGPTKRVATPKYAKVPADATDATHYANGPTGKVRLKKTADREEGDGFDFVRGVGTLRLTKDVGTLFSNWPEKLTQYQGRVNNTSFFRFKPGRVQFMNADITPQSGIRPFQQFAGLFWHIELMFRTSSETLSLDRRPHWIDLENTGHVSQVFREEDNAVQLEDFKVAMQADLRFGLLRVFPG